MSQGKINNKKKITLFDFEQFFFFVKYALSTYYYI